MTAEQLVDVATDVRLEIDLLASNAELNRSRHIRSDGRWALDLTELNCHVRARGAFDTRSVAILFVEREADATICRARMDDCTVLIIPGGSEISANVRGGLRYSAALVPLAQWQEIETAACGKAARQEYAVAMRIDRRVGARLATMLADMPGRLGSRGSVGADGLPPSLEDYLGTVAAARSDPRSTLPSLRSRMQQAGLAEDYIRANLAEEISVTQLCRVAGASRRQLEYAFRSVFSVGPHEFVRLMRLNECRRRLHTARDEGRSITEVALDLGISHLGRFAASYKLLFGELPSATYRNAGR